MKIWSITVIALIMTVLSCTSEQSDPDPVGGCQDIRQGGQLNILTLNTVFDAPAAVRQKSWTDIAQYVVRNNVHVLLIQEAVFTDIDRLQNLLGTSNSARDLQRILNQETSEPYDLRVAWESGSPLVLSTANAVLSRCTVTHDSQMFLPIESETVFEGFQLKTTRNVQAAHLDIPGYGSLHLYNTHLCSACPVQSLEQQVKALINFIGTAETKGRGRSILLGGDLNLDLAKGAAEQAIYRQLTEAGFLDLYAEYRKSRFGDPLMTLCGNRIPDIHCTDGVSPIRGLLGSQTGTEFSEPARVDYLFSLGTTTINESRVVFNPGNAATGPINQAEPAVSDHSGVFTQLLLDR